MKTIYIIIPILMMFACNNAVTNNNEAKIEGKTNVFSLDAVKVVFERHTDTDTVLNEYKSLQIFYNEKQLFFDSSGNYIDMGKSMFKIVKPSENVYEVYIGYDRRPSDIWQHYFLLKDGVLKHDTLPRFLNKNVILVDNKKEVAGVFVNASEHPDKSEPLDSIWYWPVLYYQLTADGVVLDSTKTKDENTKIYGKFYGFKNDFKVILPANIKLEEEIKRLENL